MTEERRQFTISVRKEDSNPETEAAALEAGIPIREVPCVECGTTLVVDARNRAVTPETMRREHERGNIDVTTVPVVGVSKPYACMQCVAKHCIDTGDYREAAMYLSILLGAKP